MSFRFLRLRGKHAKQPVGIFVTFSVLVSSLFVSPLLIPDQGAQASGVEIDKALDLDGAVLATPDIDNDTFITNGADNFTVSLWAKIDSGASLSGEEYLFQISRGTDALVFLDDGELRMKPYGQADIGSGFTPAAGAWHHYAFVFDTTSSGSQHTLYVDGQQVITDSHGTLGVRYIHFGGSSSGSLNFPGEIDEIKVWNKKSLTPSEIQNTMHSFGDGSGTGSAGLDDTNLYIYENFNDSSLNSEKGVNLSVSAGTIGGYVDVATTSETGSDTIITFPRSYITSDGGWTVPEGVGSARALSVGGGGAGGWGNGNEGGGGGGAGRLLHDTSVDLSASVHSVKVGQGGVGSTTTSTPGANGQESLAFGLRALEEVVVAVVPRVKDLMVGPVVEAAAAAAASQGAALTQRTEVWETTGEAVRTLAAVKEETPVEAVGPVAQGEMALPGRWEPAAVQARGLPMTSRVRVSPTLREATVQQGTVSP